MRKLLLGLLCLSNVLFTYAQDTLLTLSPYAQISIMTCSPGPQLYQSWGHAAILITDPDHDLSQIYNYGTFNFKTPNFYLKFVRGKLPYQLSKEQFNYFLRVYRYFGQHVDQQVLDFNQEQRQAFYEYLENNYLPENRSYFYDFFFDNCATRITDAIDATLLEQVQWDQKILRKDWTFRQAIDQDLRDRPWEDFGIDLVLGSVIDRKMTVYDYSFHPASLHELLANSVIQDSAGTKPLVKVGRRIYTAPLKEKRTHWLVLPITVFTVIFLIFLGLTLYQVMKQKGNLIADRILFAGVGLGGIVMALLWFATDHQATHVNYNLIWALPTHLIAAFALKRNQATPFWNYYLLFTLAVNTLFLILWSALPQSFHMVIIPIILTLMLRAAFRWWYWKQNQAQTGAL